MGCLIDKGPNVDLRKGNLVFSPINLLFHVRDLFWVKTSFIQIGMFNFTLRARRGKKRRSIGRKIKDSSRTPSNWEWNSSRLIPIKVCEIFRVGLIHTHTKIISIRGL